MVVNFRHGIGKYKVAELLQNWRAAFTNLWPQPTIIVSLNKKVLLDNRILDIAHSKLHTSRCQAITTLPVALSDSRNWLELEGGG